MIGDTSREPGGPMADPDSHQNGLDVDIYYPRLDRRLSAPIGSSQVDHRLAQALLDRFLAAHDDAGTPLEETVAAFGELQRAGKVRHVGVSTYTAARVRAWAQAAQAGGWPPPAAGR